MTEKRFTIVDEQFISYYGGNGYLISNGECKIWLWHSKEESQKVCDKLNSILDENEQLKRQTGNLEHTRDFCDEVIADCERLENENEQLKEQIADLENSFDICKHYKETYGDEIVHIKTTIKTMMETERTELGRSVLKQLWEAIQWH